MSQPSRTVRRKWTRIVLGTVLLAAVVLAGTTAWPVLGAYWRAPDERRNPQQPTSRPAEWAQPVAVNGLTNVHRVSADLYRSARPTAEGLREIQALGVKTVVNLEAFHSDDKMLEGTGLEDVRIPFQSQSPRTSDMVAFLKIVTDPNRTPVLVHCQHGSDRTGTMCAVYRIVVQGWTRQQAIDEMIRGGFGFHPIWQNLLEFLDELDVAALKTQAGITP